MGELSNVREICTLKAAGVCEKYYVNQKQKEHKEKTKIILSLQYLFFF